MYVARVLGSEGQGSGSGSQGRRVGGRELRCVNCRCLVGWRCVDVCLTCLLALSDLTKNSRFTSSRVHAS